MHEGDHGILDDDHDHPVPAPGGRDRTLKMIAGAVVAAAVVSFLVWQFL